MSPSHSPPNAGAHREQEAAATGTGPPAHPSEEEEKPGPPGLTRSQAGRLLPPSLPPAPPQILTEVTSSGTGISPPGGHVCANGTRHQHTGGWHWAPEPPSHTCPKAEVAPSPPTSPLPPQGHQHGDSAGRHFGKAPPQGDTIGPTFHVLTARTRVSPQDRRHCHGNVSTQPLFHHNPRSGWDPGGHETP